MMRTSALSVVFVMTVAACGGSSDDVGGATGSTTPRTTAAETTVETTTTDTATTTVETTVAATATTTGEPEAELSREARTAVTRCVDSIFTGAVMRLYAVEFADASELEVTRDLCDEASLQVEVDNTGPVGPTTLNRLALQLSTISLAVQSAITSLTIGTPDFITVENFDTPIDEAMAEIAELLG